MTECRALPGKAGLILEERIRAVEQVKRLYAVVMGFAVTVIIGNLYNVVHTDGFAPWREVPFMLAEAISFASLISLFYLGAERMLEVRYLRPESPVAGRFGVLADLVTLAAQAMLFMILANTVPDLHAPVGAPLAAWRIAQEQQVQTSFVWVLLVLNAVDSAFLVVQLIRMQGENATREAIVAHAVWMMLNLSSIAVLAFALRWFATDVSVWGVWVNKLSLVLIAWHAGRFIVDYLWTFRFYFPTEPLPPAIV